MRIRRRTMLAACAGAVPALEMSSLRAAGGTRARTGLGLVIHSFPVHVAADRARKAEAPFADPTRFVEHGLSLGVGSIQVGIGVRPDGYADRLRERARAGGVPLEGMVALPRDQADVDRLEAEVRTAKRAGAAILRTVC